MAAPFAASNQLVPTFWLVFRSHIDCSYYENHIIIVLFKFSYLTLDVFVTSLLLKILRPIDFLLFC